jgi:hypothetical protein
VSCLVCRAGKSGSPDYSLYGLYSVAPTFKVGTAVTLPTGGSVAATVGGVYKCNPKTTLKTKVTTDLVGALTVVHVRTADGPAVTYPQADGETGLCALKLWR